MLNSFKDYLLFQQGDPQNEPSANFCYMLFTESPFTEQLLDVQQNAHVQAEKLIQPDQFHCTIRYVKLMGEQNPDKFIEWLSKEQLPMLECFTSKFNIFDDQSLVLELDSPEIREWYNKVDQFLNMNGYAPSEYPSFKPHISLAYGCTSPVPTFDGRYDRLNIKFTTHRVTDFNKKPIFNHKVQPYKGLQYGVKTS